MSKPEVQQDNFHEYVIHSIHNPKQMFLAADLVSQYNRINHTNKEFKEWLKNDCTVKALLALEKSRGRIPPLDVKALSEPVNRADLPRDSTNHIFIKDVIEYHNISTNIQGYFVSGAVLHSALMWIDSAFAAQVYTFLEELRLQNLESNISAIELLQTEINKLKKRVVPNDNIQQWSYKLTITKSAYLPNENLTDEEKKELDKEPPKYVILKSHFNRCKYDKRADIKNNTYYKRDLPNGYTFKYFAYENICNVIRKYNGYSLGTNRTFYVIPIENWDDDDDTFDWEIRNALKQTRLDLCW